MTNTDYLPYACHDDAIEEYKSLRNEIIESQRQRVNLFQYSIAFIALLFGFFIRDGVLNSREALFLIALSIPPSLFSYSTRCRERRLANYIDIFLGQISPWSKLSTETIKLKFLERTSTAIVLTMLLFDVVLLILSLPKIDFNSGVDDIIWIIALAVTIVNVVIVYFTANLPDFRNRFKDELLRSKESRQSSNDV